VASDDDILEIIETDLTLKFVELGFADPAEARAVVGDVIEDVRESYGGIRYMIKRGYRTFSPRSVENMKAEYNGRNAKVLMRKYGMSRSTFYRYIRK